MSMKFILLINVKMPTIVGMLTFISMIKTSLDSLKSRNVYTFQHFCFYEQFELLCSVELSMKKFYNLGACATCVGFIFGF